MASSALDCVVKILAASALVIGIGEVSAGTPLKRSDRGQSNGSARDQAGPAQRPAQQKRAVTPELLLSDYASLSPKLSSLAWLPDSRHVIFAMARPAEAGAKPKTWIERMEVATGRRQSLVEGQSPRPSPDGSAIAYVSEGPNGKQLSVYRLQGGGIENVVALPASGAEHLEFAWSPDSRQIAYAYRPAAPAAKKSAGNLASAVVMGVEDLPPDAELWVVEVATGQKRKLVSGAYRAANLSWLADGSAIVLSSIRAAEYRDGKPVGAVLAVSTASGEVRRLVADGGVQRLRPIAAPVGGQIAFNYDPNNVSYPFYWNVATVPAAGGPVRQLTRDVYVVSAPIWSPDASRLYFTCKQAVFAQICSVTTDGAFRRLTSAPREAGSLAVAPSGKQMVWTTQDAAGRADVRVARTDGTGERVLLDLNPEAENLAVGEVREIRWKSRDGLEIPGLLIKPLGYDPARKYPLVVDVHGGPIGGVSLRAAILMSSPLEWQMWAAKGYAVLVPDYRSSAIPGWGALLESREKQDQNDRDMDDIMAGVDHVLELGIADPARLALIGHSNGSVLANWIITHSHRFKVAVSYEGIADWYHSYGSGMRVGGNAFAEWTFKGRPWDVPENYRKNSASEFVKGVTTPTLFISGDYGGGSGVENLYHLQFMYTALKQQNVDTQLIMYRGEGHVIQRPENQRDLLTRVLDWIESRTN